MKIKSILTTGSIKYLPLIKYQYNYIVRDTKYRKIFPHSIEYSHKYVHCISFNSIPVPKIKTELYLNNKNI